MVSKSYSSDSKLVPGVGRIPFPAYHGDDPYIFISYAHADNTKVFPLIKEFYDSGYHVWYDEGITPGNEWTADIAKALNKCTLFVVMITPQSVASANCKNEINFAIKKNIPIIAIHLEKTILPDDLELQIGTKQAILKYNMTQEEYVYKFTDAFGRFRLMPRDGIPIIPEKDKEGTRSFPRNSLIVLGIILLIFLLISLVSKTLLENNKRNTDAEKEESQNNEVSYQTDQTDSSPDTEEVAGNNLQSNTKITSDNLSSSEEKVTDVLESNETSTGDIHYNFGDTIEIYELGTDNIEYSIKIDEVHVMPEKFEKYTWVEYDKEVFDLLSVKCSVENFYFNESETGKLSLGSVLRESSVIVKDSDGYLLRPIERIYHGADGTYTVLTDDSIPAGSKGRFALLFYIEKGTPFVTISLDNHHGIIAKTDSITIDWESLTDE